MGEFPLGRAALAMLVVVAISGIALIASAGGPSQARRPDLTFAIFSPEHAAAYRPVIASFEREHNVRVQLQLVDQKALTNRLQSAIQVGADVPDMVELHGNTLGLFTKGRVENVTLLDLTERVDAAGLRERVVESRFKTWTSRGRVYGLPHDVHPVMLAYRRDLVEQLGIDVAQLTTWAKFVEAGRGIAGKRLPDDAVARRYMIDLPYDGTEILHLLILQRGGSLFDSEGRVAFDSDVAAETLAWYARQTRGADAIAYGCGNGQAFSKALLDGLALFYICPDWRTRQFQSDTPSLAGKMALMPMPAWEEGGRRTSVLGGTGLAFTKSCRDPELAWKLAMKLYYDAETVAPRFAETNILPPVKAAWSHPAFATPSEFYSGQALGQAYAALAPSVPSEYATAYIAQAQTKLVEAFMNVGEQYARHGEAGLDAFARAELKRRADDVRRLMDRNPFLRETLAAKEGAR